MCDQRPDFITVKALLIDALIDGQYDGLYCPDAECACTIDKGLMACEGDPSGCCAGMVPLCCPCDDCPDGHRVCITAHGQCLLSLPEKYVCLYSRMKEEIQELVSADPENREGTTHKIDEVFKKYRVPRRDYVVYWVEPFTYTGPNADDNMNTIDIMEANSFEEVAKGL